MPEPDIGLALSGGGSRAAAFHRGVLRALLELKIVDRVRTISAVSGGAVFAASWMAARARAHSDERFLSWFRGVLARGFVRPAILNWRALRVLLPGWTRTLRLAETFDELLFEGVALSDLPTRPLLCLNATVLNNASTGRFSRNGYSGLGVGEPSGGYPETTIRGLTLGLATAASAAFPFGLPPVEIERERFGLAFWGTLETHERLYLTDGGMLDNLGVERLLKSSRFGSRHIILSDAGLPIPQWRQGCLGRLRSWVLFRLSANTLERLLVVMNDKQNRTMRELLYANLVSGASGVHRCVLFARLTNRWSSIFADVPRWRREQVGVSPEAGVDVTEGALTNAGMDLRFARSLYEEMGGNLAVDELTKVPTGLSGLSDDVVDRLETHARWQIHALCALYGSSLG